MRVLQVIPSLAARTGGPAVSVVEASRALNRMGIETRVIATDMAKPARARNHHSRVSLDGLPSGSEDLDVQLHPVRRPHRLAFSPDLARALRRTVTDYDVVHIHSLFLYPQLAAYHAAIHADVPYVVSPRGALDPWLRQRGRLRKGLTDVLWQRRMLAGASALHVTSEQEADFITDIAPSVPRVIVPNGIQWSAFQSLPPRERFRQDFLDGFEGPLILVHGRLTRKKGLDLLIRAFSIISGQLTDCRLALVGPDDDGLTPELIRIANEVGVSNRVAFCGMLVGEDRLAALSAADVWALPSHTENFAVAVVEALAAGRPVVVSPAVGVARDAQQAGAAVVSEMSPPALAAELSRLLSDTSVADELGARAREYSRRYDWAQVAPQLGQMYAEVAA